ncbi:response regulator transcription factor [Propionibacteriaceae bacterium Y1923]
MSTILIIEDEVRISSFISKGLHAAGFTTHATTSGVEGVQHAVHGDFDLVILDVGLPDIDGFEVLERLRGQGVNVPVIMLTARGSVTDRVAGLEGGADDYMSKPFSFEELLARVKLRLRSDSSGDSGAQQSATTISHNGLVLDYRTRRAEVDGKQVDLSAREFALAETFLRHPQQVFSREQLLSNVWGYDFDPNSNVVDVYVRYLRKKLGAERFETVRGMGYRLV